ncbi:MAG: ABC transporter ATP-binding protein [Rhodospirillales bacterium]|nr:ABC transporter ATP-binding protein [Rhodospirillales bacterium]
MRKSYGRHLAVRDVGLVVEEGEFVVILGPSGCGKTTTLRCLAGLEKPDDGTIRIGTATVFDGGGAVFVPPEQRNIGMIFQSYALWPHMTVFENVAFPFEARRQRGPQVRDRVRDVLALVGLAGLEDRSASLLSGGQMQRVALARALACKPAALLFDEPLSNLDLKLRHHLRQELRELQKTSGASAVFVTHDQSEAAALADRIVVMNEGRIVQSDTPEKLFSRPADRFTADFIGIPNLLPVRAVTAASDGRWKVDVSPHLALEGEAPSGVRPGDGWWVWFRAEHVEMTAAAPRASGCGDFPARIVQRTFTGTDYVYRLQAGHAPEASVEVTARDVRKLEPGDLIAARVLPGQAHLVPDATAR